MSIPKLIVLYLICLLSVISGCETAIAESEHVICSRTGDTKSPFLKLSISDKGAIIFSLEHFWNPDLDEADEGIFDATRFLNQFKFPYLDFYSLAVQFESSACNFDRSGGPLFRCAASASSPIFPLVMRDDTGKVVNIVRLSAVVAGLEKVSTTYIDNNGSEVSSPDHYQLSFSAATTDTIDGRAREGAMPPFFYFKHECY